MKYQYAHLGGRLFYIDADIPSDVNHVELEAGGVKVEAKKLFWRFYWITTE
jgi:hypothetical protein